MIRQTRSGHAFAKAAKIHLKITNQPDFFEIVRYKCKFDLCHKTSQ